MSAKTCLINLPKTNNAIAKFATFATFFSNKVVGWFYRRAVPRGTHARKTKNKRVESMRLWATRTWSVRSNLSAGGGCCWLLFCAYFSPRCVGAAANDPRVQPTSRENDFIPHYLLVQTLAFLSALKLHSLMCYVRWEVNFFLYFVQSYIPEIDVQLFYSDFCFTYHLVFALLALLHY